MYPAQICNMHVTHNQFLDNFNNGGGLLSSVLLFQMIFNFKRWLEADAYFRRRRALLDIYMRPSQSIPIPHWM